MDIRKNDILEAEVLSLSSEGNGICKIKDFVVFVPNAIPGDKLLIKILKVKKNYAFSKIEKILKPSSNRIKPDCDSFPKCGGCTFRNLKYESELLFKERKVKDSLEKIGGIKDLKIEKIIPSEKIDGYRNKAQLPISIDKSGNYIVGFYAKHTHRVVDCKDCKLQPEVFRKSIEAFLAWANKTKPSVYDERLHSGLLRHLYLRIAEKTDEVMFSLVINGDDIEDSELLINTVRRTVPQVKSIILNINKADTNVVLGKENKVMWGKGCLTDELCGLKFNISPNSFYQVNRSQTEKLYSLVKEYADLSGSETVLDLYCGTGTIGLTMAKKCKKLIGVEIVEQAIENAKNNAKMNNIKNASFVCMDAKLAFEELKKRGNKIDVVVIDPPRKGCDENVVNLISHFKVPKVIYVSCDPATLARDLKLFAERSYKIKNIGSVDMFSRTAHVETVILLSRKAPDAEIKVRLDMSELDITSAESKATYKEIQEYVKNKYDLHVTNLYIAQVKREFGIIERENYNTGEGKAKVPQVTAEKREAIIDALKYFQMIE